RRRAGRRRGRLLPLLRLQPLLRPPGLHLGAAGVMGLSGVRPERLLLVPPRLVAPLRRPCHRAQPQPAGPPAILSARTITIFPVAAWSGPVLPSPPVWYHPGGDDSRGRGERMRRVGAVADFAGKLRACAPRRACALTCALIGMASLLVLAGCASFRSDPPPPDP